jgi:hypothetical protein
MCIWPNLIISTVNGQNDPPKGLVAIRSGSLREGETARVLLIRDPVAFVERLAWCDNCPVRRASRDGHIMRSFEIAAVGGCMLAQDIDEHREIFGSEGEAVVYFRRETLSWPPMAAAMPNRSQRILPKPAALSDHGRTRHKK